MCLEQNCRKEMEGHNTVKGQTRDALINISKNTVHNKVWIIVNYKKTKTNNLRGHINTYIENIKLFKSATTWKDKIYIKSKVLEFQIHRGLVRGGKSTKTVTYSKLSSPIWL